MSANTSIEWTDRTWNPVRGCSVISPGCVNCYAMKQAHRFSGPGKPYEGLTKLTKAGPQWTGKIRAVDEALLEPLSWRKPARVFVNSMSDLFHEDVPDEFILQVMNTIRAGHANGHTFQVLTKRAERMRAFMSRLQFDSAGAGRMYLEDRGLNRQGLPMSFGPVMRQLWLGVSVENKDALQRIDALKDTPAAVRFVSFEPLLEELGALILDGIHWAIFGGESGPGARPTVIQWVRNGVKECRRQNVAPFVKQLGAVPVVNCQQCGRMVGRVPGGLTDACGPAHSTLIAESIRIRDPKGGDMAEWPEDLRVREFPKVAA